MRAFSSAMILAVLAVATAATSAHADGTSDDCPIGDRLDRVVRLGVDARDLVHDGAVRAARYLDGLAVTLDVSAPDLTILTTEPLPELEKSSGYGWRSDPIHHDHRFHHGTDMRAPYGTPVVAAGPGVVVFAGRQSGYGNVVYVDHGGGIVTRYAHLQAIDTRKAATLAAGERLGRVGSTGRATGPHLHFEVRIDGRDVNPLTAMSVAALQRDQPELGRVSAFALGSELQKREVSTEDRKRASEPVQAKKSAPTAPPQRTRRPIKPNV